MPAAFASLNQNRASRFFPHNFFLAATGGACGTRDRGRRTDGCAFGSGADAASNAALRSSARCACSGPGPRFSANRLPPFEDQHGSKSGRESISAAVVVQKILEGKSFRSAAEREASGVTKRTRNQSCLNSS